MNLRAGVPMSLVCKGRLAGILLLGLICISCGDTYRPTIIPNPVLPPDPKNFHAVIAVNQNSPFYPGTGMQLDVSGDSNAGVTKVAMGPVHAAVINSRIWVANSLSNSVSVFSPASSGGSIGASTDVNLPPGFSPVFVHSTEFATMYVANATSPDPNAGRGTVDVINTAGAIAVTNVITVGKNPVAMAETPDPNLPFNRELYIVNQGDNNVTHIHTVDQTQAVTSPIAVGASPSLAYARSDNQKIFVLNQGSGTITTINTLDDSFAGPPVPADVGANFMIYDSHRNRLYVTSSTGSLFVYDAAASAPALLKQIAVPGAGDCAQCVPLSVAALSDGTRVYVGSAFETTDSTKCAQVVGGPPVNCYLTQITVIDAGNLTIRTGSAASPNPFPVPTPSATLLAGAPVLAQAGCATTRFRLSVVPASDSSRVFLAACDAGGVSTINTTNDTYVVTLPTPVSAFPPIQTDPNVPPQPPRQNPVFLLTGQ